MPTSFGSGFADPHILPEPRYRIPPFSRVIPGLGAMALGIARTAIETFSDIAGARTPERTTQMLRNNHGAQVRVFQAESLVCSARLFLFDSLSRLWSRVVSTGEAPMEQRAHVRLAASHAVFKRRPGRWSSLYRRWRERALHELSAGAGIPGCARNNAAHWCPSTRHGNDRPSFVWTRTGHAIALTQYVRTSPISQILRLGIPNFIQRALGDGHPRPQSAADRSRHEPT